MSRIRRKLSAKLSIGITLLVTPIFVLALGILFLYSRQIIRQETIKHAVNVLHTTTQRLRTQMNLIENGVNSNSWLLEENFQPDSLEIISQRIATLNRTINSCRVITSPDEIARMKYGFAVSVSTGDTIFTYSKPLRPDGDSIKAVVMATLSYKQLSSIIKEAEQPFPGSYFMLVDKDQTCDTENSRVFYSTLPDTDWNLVLVCPDSELMKICHQLFYIAFSLLAAGLLFTLLICYLITRRTIKPLNQLLTISKKIVEGHYEEMIPSSSRKDAIGRLQNSFAVMQQSLFKHVSSIRETAQETTKHNTELAHAMKLAEEAVKKKELFIQNVSHQMRTPLNIVMGFADVLHDSLTAQRAGNNQGQLQEEEVTDITETMTYNAVHLNRMIQMLFDSSEYGSSQELFSQKNDRVSCNDIARECLNYARERFPKVTIHFATDLSDNTVILTNHLYLMRTLRELLFNSAKYSDGQHITLRVTDTPSSIHFAVEDVGPGIAPEALNLLFKPFVKVDDLSEGLGLGLPLAKRHAISLGGDLIYDADYQKGCHFILEVPK